jgi:hypothetical protein
MYEIYVRQTVKTGLADSKASNVISVFAGNHHYNI